MNVREEEMRRGVEKRKDGKKEERKMEEKDLMWKATLSDSL